MNRRSVFRMPEISVSEPRFLRIDAATVCDAFRTFAPGSLLLELRDSGPPISGAIRAHATVIAAGSVARIDARPQSNAARRLSLPRAVLIPGLVNAHTHLDLSHIGPRPFDAGAGFLGFVTTVRSNRRIEPVEIAQSVRCGVEMSLKSGVVCVGDIAGAVMARANAAAFDALAASETWGVSFVEYFAIGKTEGAAWARAESVIREAASRGTARVRAGLQPHATNTVSPNAYRLSLALAGELGLPISTHLAETPEEREFIARATGPQRVLLEAVGVWDESLLADFGVGRSPVRHFADAIRNPRSATLVAAHVNDLGEDLGAFAGLGASVAYCPTASEYFGAEGHFGPHRYRDLIAAGVNVALGTDSIINLPASRPGLSVWEEMRRLRARDRVAPDVLLRMATANGARALGLEESLFRFEPGNRLAGVAAVRLPPGAGDAEDNLALALDKGANPELVLLGK
ncbi:aminodeoxyfutalosine deaminase [Phycisphaerales bacterium]|nr:aminodeoxyfutalosine deaminase [Phycisphaerales bacterium]